MTLVERLNTFQEYWIDSGSMDYGEMAQASDAWDYQEVKIVEQAQMIEELESVIQKCFDDICKPSGKISKSTARLLMKHANTSA